MTTFKGWFTVRPTGERKCLQTITTMNVAMILVSRFPLVTSGALNSNPRENRAVRGYSGNRVNRFLTDDPHGDGRVENIVQTVSLFTVDKLSKKDRGFESRAEKGSPRKVSSGVERLRRMGGKGVHPASPRT